MKVIRACTTKLGWNVHFPTVVVCVCGHFIMCISVIFCNHKIEDFALFCPQMNVFPSIHLIPHVPKSRSPDCPTRIGLERGDADAGRAHTFVQEYATTLGLCWEHISETRTYFSWWIEPGWPVTPNGSAIINTRYCGSNCGTVSWATALNEALRLLAEPEGGNGFPSSPDTAAGCVGFSHWRMVCGPPSEHVLQLLPPLPLDISPGLPLPAVHGKASSSVGFLHKAKAESQFRVFWGCQCHRAAQRLF